MSGLFITAVGTGIGKTLVTTILCHQLIGADRKVHAIKPVVSGFSLDDPRNDPALILRSLGRQPTPQSIAAIAPWRLAALCRHTSPRHGKGERSTSTTSPAFAGGTSPTTTAS